MCRVANARRHMFMWFGDLFLHVVHLAATRDRVGEPTFHDVEQHPPTEQGHDDTCSRKTRGIYDETRKQFQNSSRRRCDICWVRKTYFVHLHSGHQATAEWMCLEALSGGAYGSDHARRRRCYGAPFHRDIGDNTTICGIATPATTV